MNKWQVLVAGALMAVNAGAMAAGDAEAGKAKAGACGACHGADGNSMIPANPKLAGQNASYIMKQLHDFKSGSRENMIMTGQAAGLNDTDIENIAAYYSSQQVKPGDANPDLLEAGQKLYQAGNAETGVPACMACHGPDGKGNDSAKFPALSGQHVAYTTTQLKAFRSGERANDMNGMMSDIAKKMSDAEIEAVASYIQGLY